MSSKPSRVVPKLLLSLFFALLFVSFFMRRVLRVHSAPHDRMTFQPRSFRITLPVEGQVPPFSLRESSGKMFKESDLNGKIWIADFIYTRCSDACPLLSARMSKLQTALKFYPNVALVSFTVDPGYDTPAVLRKYARRYGALKNHWFFLTGDSRFIRTLGEKTFHLSIVSNPGHPGQILGHSSLIGLVDARGRIRGYYDSGYPELLKKLVRDAGALAKKAG